MRNHSEGMYSSPACCASLSVTFSNRFSSLLTLMLPPVPLTCGKRLTASFRRCRSGGTFILRIDDTDPGRSIAENTAQILRSLEWLGIDWDEGPGVGGPYGPYFQTERADHYTAAIERMKADGNVQNASFIDARIADLKGKTAGAAKTNG